MGETTPEKRSGCGILSAVFGRKNIWPRRTTSTGSIPTANPNNLPRVPSTPNSKRRKGGTDDPAFSDSSSAQGGDGSLQKDRIIARPPPNYAKPQPTPPASNQNQGKRALNEAPVARSAPPQGYAQCRKVPQGAIGISGELDSMIKDHQRSKGAGSLVRASSGNVMLHGNLGNLRQPGGANVTNKAYDYEPRNARVENGKYSTSGMGNVVKKQHEESAKPAASLCRALSTKMDPEQLKILGNEDYKNGRFAEALALYDAAISIEPNKASYRSNKSAALTALGRLLEAVFECREAIRIEPFYQRSHNRLATLYLRLGEAEKVIYHHKHAGAEAEPEVLHRAKNLQVHLNKCTEAKRQRDWNTLLKESSRAISAGADSAPQIFALKAEALLKLNRHQDADETMKNGPNFDADECTKFFGPIGNATLLVIRAQVDMAAGRFDDAVAAAQRAARLDSNNKEASMVVRRTGAVAAARSHGNNHFKAGRYSEACVAYGGGLNHDPYNSVLLCNRAACRSKLGQYEKALEDCNAALSVRPNFSKARLRRADCYTKMQNWEACIQDCEVLIKENPNDEEMGRMLKEAQAQLRKRRGSQDMKVINYNKSLGNASDIVVVSSNESFRDYVTSPGISVVLFSDEPGDRPIMQFLEQLHRRYPSVNFLKVEVEDHLELAKSEGLSSLPAFNIYKNGSRTKEISGYDHDLLESTIKSYTS